MTCLAIRFLPSGPFAISIQNVQAVCGWIKLDREPWTVQLILDGDQVVSAQLFAPTSTTETTLLGPPTTNRQPLASGVVVQGYANGTVAYLNPDGTIHTVQLTRIDVHEANLDCPEPKRRRRNVTPLEERYRDEPESSAGGALTYPGDGL